MDPILTIKRIEDGLVGNEVSEFDEGGDRIVCLDDSLALDKVWGSENERE